MSEFEFWVNISQQGDITSPTTIIYKGDGKTKLYSETGAMSKYSWDTQSHVFKNLIMLTPYTGVITGYGSPPRKF